MSDINQNEMHGALKPRFVEEHFRTMGAERGAMHCIKMLAEYQFVIMQGQKDLATTLDQLADIVGNFVAIADNMKSAVDQLQAKHSNEVLPDDN